jgi:excisionase family DNA binding protein
MERKTKTVDETAKILGLSRSSTYEAVRTGQIESIRIGGRIIIPDAVISRMLGEATETSDPSEPTPAAA